MSRRLAALLLINLCLVPLARAQEPAPSLDQLAWLAGCWQRQGANLIAQEQWMAPLGDAMIGMSRTVRNGKTVAYELLRIERRDGRWTYVATPSSQRETAFALVELTDNLAVFANPEHDFPQWIRYRRLADGSLLAQIEGKVSGKNRTVDFPMTRTPCAGSTESGERR